MSRRSLLHGLLFVGLLTGLSACLSIKTISSADPHLIYHHNWWNYYERGRLYLREGQPELAKSDFETALGLKSGARFPYAHDRWRVRTYGLHVVEGYFPHRELGICFYELGNLEKALSFLETSLRMEPSARAKHYLNLVRRKLVKTDSAPRITLKLPPLYTDQRIVKLNGTASGENYISAISVNGQPEFIELAKQEVPFQQTIPLQEGPNSILISATDLSGQKTETNLTIYADFTPPQVVLQNIDFIGNNYEITLTCRDNLNLAQLNINEQKLSPTGNTYTVSLHLGKTESIQLTASDRAGNTLAWNLGPAALDRLAHRHEDRSPPQLLPDDCNKTITLYNNEYALDIHAEDDTCLRSIELNSTPLLTEQSPAFHSLQRIPLSLGTNRFTLTATDISGKQTERKITIIRRKPEYLDRHYRLTATLPPVSGELPDESFGHKTDLLFAEEITRDPVRFYLLAGQQDVECILNEQKLSKSELADPRAALSTGKLLNADLVFVSRVLSDGRGQTIYTQVLDAHSEEPLFTEDVYLEKSRDLARQIAGLTMKIEQRFPLIQARIAEHNGTFSIDAGTRQGVQKGTRFLVIHSDGPFEQGRVLKNENRIIELIASEIEFERSNAIIFPKSAKGAVQPGDYVFTR